MKAISYIRVSTSKQTTERQSLTINSYCQNNNIEIVKEFSEIESGFKDVRDVLTELLDYVVDNDINYVIVDELSRLGRNEQVITSIKKIHNSKCGFISLKENIRTDITNEAGLQMANLLITFLSGINTFEISSFKYRSKAGVEKSVRNGGVTGSLNYAYGYMNDGNKKLVINDDEALVIKKIFDLYVAGNGTTLIANYLNDNNISTRSKKIVDAGKNKSEYNYNYKWSDGVVRSILINSIYKGDRIFKGEILKQSQLQIIDTDIFDEVQMMMKGNYNKGQVRNPNFNYIIPKRLLICGSCGRTYYAHKRESGKDNRYICLSGRYKEKCDNVGINIDKMENLIQEVIFYILNDKLLEVLDDKKLNINLIELNNQLVILDNQLNKNLKEEKKVFELAVSGDFPKSFISEKLEEIKNNNKFIFDKKENLKIQISDLEKMKNNLQDIENLRINFKSGDKLSSDIISKIINKITITNQTTFPSEFNNFKGDKVLEIKIETANQELKFLISQRTNLIFYYHAEFNIWVPFNKFLSGEYPKKAFDFIMGIS